MKVLISLSVGSAKESLKYAKTQTHIPCKKKKEKKLQTFEEQTNKYTLMFQIRLEILLKRKK